MDDTPRSCEARNLVVTVIEDRPKAILLLHMARKRAQELNGAWRAVFIETSVTHSLYKNGQHERILRLLTIARQMGGETEVLEAPDLIEGIRILVNREESCLGLMIIGGTEAPRHFGFFRQLPWMQAINLASRHTQVEIVPLSGLQYAQSWREWLHIQLREINPLHLLYALGIVGLALGLIIVMSWLVPTQLVNLEDLRTGALFVLACAIAAGRFGLLPGLTAAVAGFVVNHYIFTQPRYSFQVQAVSDAISLGVFLLAAVLVSVVTSHARNYTDKIAKSELGTRILFTLYQVTSEASSGRQALQELQQKLQVMLEMEVAFFLPPPSDTGMVETEVPETLALNDRDRLALQECWNGMRTTGFAAPYNPGTAWRFEPMIIASGAKGILAVRFPEHRYLDVGLGRLLSAIAEQTANILEHIELERSMEAARISEEREKLRSMLLSSVSHDLKTPLAGIIGALSVYKSLGNRLSAEKREELVDSSLEEAQRLDSFITNILEMTRLETGNVKFKMGWHNVLAIVENALKRMHGRLQKREVIVHPLPKDVEVCIDLSMMEQVLQNLLDNACKYTPVGTTIEIGCTVHETEGVICTVRDHGEGIPPERLEQVFDKYARLRKKDTQVAGTGLGLSIAKAIMEAQGGWIIADNHPEGGAVLTFCLPKWRASAVVESRRQPVCKEVVCP